MKTTAATLFALFLITTTAHAAEKVCAGVLTDMRTIGVQLGDCDLNSISANDFKHVKDACGEPDTIDEHNDVHCTVRAIVAARNGAGVFIAHKILKAEKR
jgi:hypothetical protein